MSKNQEKQEKGKEIQLVVFRLRGEEFGAEISQVLEISRRLPITHLPEAPGFVEGVVNLRGQVIPVVDLSRQFGLKHLAELPKSARIVVVEVGQETVGLMVDEVPEVLRLPEADVEPPPERVHSEASQEYVKGVAKLGQRLIVVLDLNKVLVPQQIEAAGKLAETAGR